MGNLPGTGMHGGKMFLHSRREDVVFPPQVTARPAEPHELREIDGHLSEFCRPFGYDMDEILSAPFAVVTPGSKNPYRQMYAAN